MFARFDSFNNMMGAYVAGFLLLAACAAVFWTAMAPFILVAKLVEWWKGPPPPTPQQLYEQNRERVREETRRKKEEADRIAEAERLELRRLAEGRFRPGELDENGRLKKKP